MMVTNDNHKLVVNAIIEQACIDYLKALRVLDKTRGNDLKSEDKRLRARGRLAEVRHFFKSKWYVMLSEMDGKRMLKTLNKSYRELRESGNLNRIDRLIYKTT